MTQYFLGRLVKEEHCRMQENVAQQIDAILSNVVGAEPGGMTMSQLIWPWFFNSSWFCLTG